MSSSERPGCGANGALAECAWRPASRCPVSSRGARRCSSDIPQVFPLVWSRRAVRRMEKPSPRWWAGPFAGLGVPAGAGLGHTAMPSPLGKGARAGVGGTSGPQPRLCTYSCAGHPAQGQGRSAETQARGATGGERPSLCARGDTCAPSIPSLAPRWKGGRGIWGPGLLRRRFNYRFSAAGRWARIGKEGGSAEPCHFPTSAASSKGGIQTFSPQAAEWTVVAPA